ncbi:attacin-E [Manduca sexta]|uniref:Attacin n=1 Tax=Manduca sexta TaxID=7130 RepID=A0A921ZX73_MANSE|nr:attacin-E [Manduca sexta]KAG6465354.1 hypothetical protein O3G_MSEX015096 [Manduca sexta]
MMFKSFVLLCLAACVLADLGKITINQDGTSGVGMKLPLAHNDKNVISAVGAAGFTPNLKLGSATAGLALDNVKGHSLTLTDTHIPGRGDKLSAEGTLNLFRDANHKLDANAFASRNMPDTPYLPNYNTYGGGLDYMFKDKVGASFTAAHSDFIDRNDYSLGGKLNLYRSPSSSLDFKAGLNKFDMPSMSSGWEPFSGFSFSKFF